MTCKCALLVLSALALSVPGCGSVEPSDRLDGSVDGSSGDSSDGSPDGGSMISRVQVLAPTFVDAPTITAQMSLTPGNVVIAVPYWNDSSHTVTVTDALSQVWTPLARQSVQTGCSRNLGTNLQMFYASITATGSTTVSATQSGGAGLMGMFIVEYSGVTGDALDATAGEAAQIASNKITAGTLTTTGFGVVVAAFHDSMGGGAMIPGPGFTAVIRDTDAYAMLADMMAPAGMYEASANLPASMSDACWVAAALALRMR